MRVLQSAGSPRPLPKLPPPPTARPRAARTLIAVDIRIQHDRRTIDVHTRDLSTSGFFGVTNEALEIGVLVDCELRMPAPTGLSEQSFNARAKIVRRELSGYGFELVDPPAPLVAAIAAVVQIKPSE
jgi:hypothetical protein